MLLYRAKPWLGVWLALLLTSVTANAQEYQDMQLFAPAEFDQFGGGTRADQGLFFQFDGLYWWILPPDTDPIGKPGLTRDVFFAPDASTVQHNTLSNSNISADAVGGQRYEFGCVHGHQGFMVSIFDLTDQTQRLAYSEVDIVFDDQPFLQVTPDGSQNIGRLWGYVADVIEATDTDGEYINMTLRPLPVTFDEVILRNEVSVWGTEANYFYRTHPVHHGGIFEFFCGVRYFAFDETFSFEGYGNRFQRVFTEPGDDEEDEELTATPLAPGTILADSFWWADAQNHIVGPQLALRWFKQSQRLTLSTEARFFAGFNFQHIDQEGVLGTELDEGYPTVGRVQSIPPNSLYYEPFTPITMDPVGFKHTRTAEEWSPGVELRFDLQYKLTRSIDFKVGWSALWIDGIARASNLIDYTLTETSLMGIDMADNRQSVFMHGLNIGFNVNR